MEDGRIEVVYRGTDNCDPYLVAGQTIPDGIKVNRDYFPLYPDELEPAEYLPAQCDLNMYEVDPTLFQSCPIHFP
jgi:hypothetical protein